MTVTKITNDSIRAAASNAVTRKAIVKARVIGGRGEDEAQSGVGKTKSAPEDPFAQLVSTGQVIEAPFDLLNLSMMGENNSELGQVIEAMETNIEGFGQRYKSRLVKPADEDLDKKLVKAAELERIRLENFFAYATDESFTEFRRKLRSDLEYTGNAYGEVIRDAQGKVQGFTHIPSYQIRLGIAEKELIEYKRPILELQADKSVKVVKVTAYKRFRPMAQSRFIHRSNLSLVGTSGTIWFKEYGDPREIDCRTGREFEEGKRDEKEFANEMIHWKLYSPRTPYGLPRYIGNLLAIMGDRASEEINYMTFKNNNIPSMVVAVSNGQLTEGSIDRISSFVESDIQGSSNYSKFLIVEAEGDEEGEDGNQVKLDIKPLTKDQHDDAMFQKYSANNQEKVRRAFRMPPIFVGMADGDEATTDSSRKLADEQIFAPERCVFDEFINRKLFPDMGIVYHKFITNSPNTTDNATLAKVMGLAEKTGAQTPAIARAVLEEILGRELPPFPKDFPTDVPFSQTMAEAVKNKAEPSEPGQQVTALKSLKSLDADSGDVIEYLLGVRKAMEAEWTAHLEEDADGCCESDK